MVKISAQTTKNKSKIKEIIDKSAPGIREALRADQFCVNITIKGHDHSERQITLNNVDTQAKQLELSIALTLALADEKTPNSILTSYKNFQKNEPTKEYLINLNTEDSNTSVPVALNKFGVDFDKMDFDLNFGFETPFIAIIQKTLTVKLLHERLAEKFSNYSEIEKINYCLDLFAPSANKKNILKRLEEIKKPQ